MLALYDRIGKELVCNIVTRFYDLAFEDGIIGHFFFNKNKSHLIQQQIAFTSVLLGAKNLTYSGKSIQEAHKNLAIGLVHFQRRQRILSDVMDEMALEAELKKAWLDMENKLKPQIFSPKASCEGKNQ